MPHAPFVHLRVRSCYSLLESSVRLKNLLQRCRADLMPAVGIADRANLFDALQTSLYAAKAGVQPLVGCLLPVQSDDPASANGRPPAPALLPVLVQNEAGYRAGSAIHYAEGLRGHLLLIHGSGDDNVHMQGTERLINRLVELHKPFDLMIYPNRTHAISEGPGTSVHVFKRIARHFLENLPAEPR